eukprot:1002183-Amphidinium_carterae.1
MPLGWWSAGSLAFVGRSFDSLGCKGSQLLTPRVREHHEARVRHNNKAEGSEDSQTQQRRELGQTHKSSYIDNKM